MLNWETKKDYNENTLWQYNDWYVRMEYRRVNGEKRVYYYVGNDNTEYRRAFRDPFTAMDYAEKIIIKRGI